MRDYCRNGVPAGDGNPNPRHLAWLMEMAPGKTRDECGGHPERQIVTSGLSRLDKPVTTGAFR
jgi:hypothetical protein